MLWLGSASFASKIIDALSLIIVLRFLTREELGTATLAWSITTFVESFNGMGINAAVVQRAKLGDDDVASAHWYAVTTSIAFMLLVCVLAPPLSQLYGAPELSPMVQLSSCKLLFVGLANVPLALLSRGLKFRTLGAVASGATLFSATLTIVLAAAGAGAWAPLLGNTAHGLFQFVGVCVFAPLWPRFSMSLSRLRPMIGPGLNVAAGSALSQLTRNLDYFVVGHIAGLATLGTYRVAFDLAMAPTLAILQVMGRSALPVYSRLAGDVDALTKALAWTVRNTALLALGPLLLVFFEGESVFLLLGKGADPGLVPVLRCLCVAALLRTLVQPYPHLLVAWGRAGRGLLEAVLTTVLLSVTLALCVRFLVFWPVPLRIACAWILTYLSLPALEIQLTRDIVPQAAVRVLRSLYAPLGVALSVTAVMGIIGWLSPLGPGALRAATHGGLVVLLYVFAVRQWAGVRLRRLFGFGDVDTRA
jgi:O-antigen/teichoic acid export membrane protein